MVQDVVLTHIDIPKCHENILNVPHPKKEVKDNAPLLSFRWDDGPNEIEPSHALRHQSFQSCPDCEGYYHNLRILL
jgi:hypothetical protein